MKHIVVASENPVKISAALDGFKRMFPDEEFTVEGVSVASGVPDQPMGDEETLLGAVNRADNAKSMKPGADYYIGLEGGLEERGDEMAAFAWMVVVSADGTVGKGRTSVFFLPPQITALIKEGKELAEADDIVFNRVNSKHQNGAVGILTHDTITRTSYYAEAVVLALIPFKNPELYDNQ